MLSVLSVLSALSTRSSLSNYITPLSRLLLALKYPSAKSLSAPAALTRCSGIYNIDFLFLTKDTPRFGPHRSQLVRTIMAVILLAQFGQRDSNTRDIKTQTVQTITHSKDPVLREKIRLTVTTGVLWPVYLVQGPWL